MRGGAPGAAEVVAVRAPARVLGAALGAASGLLRTVRTSGRPLHPRGTVLRGTLRTGELPDAVGTVAPYDGPVLVRVSRSVGLPHGWPDVHGVAFRWVVDGSPHDVLLSSTGRGRLSRFLLTVRRSPWAGAFGSLMPFRTPAGPVLVAALPSPGARPADQVDLVLYSARWDGPWHPWGRLVASTPAQEDPRFDPVLHAPAGLETYPWAAALRLPAYRRARGRSADPSGRAA